MIPVIFYCLGFFVCIVQSFVFTMLSAIYISGAVSHATGTRSIITDDGFIAGRWGGEDKRRGKNPAVRKGEA